MKKFVCIVFLSLLFSPIPSAVFSHSANNFETPKESSRKTSMPAISFSLNAGNLPRLIWVDDIHPADAKKKHEKVQLVPGETVNKILLL